MNLDNINAGFELAAGFILLLNVKEILKSKRVEGVHIFPAFFFMTWSIWNLIYYPAINQNMSFKAAIFIVFVDAAWIFLALKYRKST